jgi:hypothetical protein
MDKSDAILFSGGAPGAEAAFGACAERFGIEEVNFTFEGHKIERHRGVRVLNHEELQSGDVSLEYVSKLMNRRYTDSPTIRKVLQTIWYQVNAGQEIYVIGRFSRTTQCAAEPGGARSSRSCVTSRFTRSIRTKTPGLAGRVVNGSPEAKSIRRRSATPTSQGQERASSTRAGSARSPRCSIGLLTLPLDLQPFR